MVRAKPQKSVKAVREEKVKLRGVGFVKQVGLKPGMKASCCRTVT